MGLLLVAMIFVVVVTVMAVVFAAGRRAAPRDRTGRDRARRLTLLALASRCRRHRRRRARRVSLPVADASHSIRGHRRSSSKALPAPARVRWLGRAPRARGLGIHDRRPRE